jgi:hypothetical protein
MAETRPVEKPRLQIDPQQFAQEVANEIAADLRRNGTKAPRLTEIEEHRG